MRHKRSFASLHRLRGNRRLSARVYVGGTTALGRSRILAEDVERLLYRLPQLPCRRQGVDELVWADEGDMALPRAGPAEPGDPFAAKVLHLYQRVRRGASRHDVALRAPAEGVDRNEPRAERGEPGKGFGVEAHARVAGVADERVVFAEKLVEQRPAPVVGAHLRLGNGAPFRRLRGSPK